MYSAGSGLFAKTNTPGRNRRWKRCQLLYETLFDGKNLNFGGFTVEFVTCGVELLRGHCTDIPADQGSWKRICAICSF